MRQTYFTIPAALALLAGCAIPPQGVSQADLAAYDEAVASIGCAMVDDSDYLPVELQTGLSRDQLLKVAGYKIAAEQAVALDDGGIRLTTGACANAAPPAS